MLGKSQRSVIGNLSELLVSGSRAALLDPAATTSPREPLDPRALHSPRGPKSYDLGGVGVGILAALETSATAGRCLCRRRIAVSSDQSLDCFDDSENYTYVTCYGPNCQSFTKVYYGGGEYLGAGLSESTTSQVTVEEFPPFPAMELLSFCSSCKKKLDGEDVYNYRGESAVCSSECGLREITGDDRKELCRSDSSSLSKSPYTIVDIFSKSMGIIAI